MELSYLYYFKTIAETENMSRAAAELHVSQPALSKAMSRLESSLGVALFQRKRGRISLTDIGREYYNHVANAFECIDDGQRVIDEYLRQNNESVVIAAPVSELLNALILKFLDSHEHEDIRIAQYFYQPDELKQKLLDGALDFGLTPIPLDHSDLEQMKLMDEEVFLVVSKKHWLANRNTIALAELKNERFLVNEASFDLKIVTDNCLLAGFEPRVTLCSNETSVITEALEQNRGISLVPANVVYTKMLRDGKNSAVSALRITDVDVSRFISVAKRRDRMLSENARILYRFAVKYFTELGKTFEEHFGKLYPPSTFEERKSLYIKEALDPKAE